ncbi:hypothetical protein [Variovorax sp.]|uniref:hypothetical protein n=1 Tax=Variovorax sp. TaxID=1871043 RepID=UPI003BABB381
MPAPDSLSDLRVRYARILGQLDTLIEYSRELARRFNGIVPETKAQVNAAPIFIKQVCHAISLRRLMPAQIDGGPRELWDAGSVCALARCVIDAYDALAYFALDAVTEEERDFRELLSDLHDQERRTKMLDFIGSTQPEAITIRANALALRVRARVHPFFARVGKTSQQKIAQGDAPQYYLSQRERNQVGGIDHRHYLSATIYLSQYVHTTPMAINQWRHFKAGGINEVRVMMLSMQHALPYFAKGVHAIMVMFPREDEVPQTVADVLDFWLPVAEGGVPGRGPDPRSASTS